jgi:hypothetical protein
MSDRPTFTACGACNRGGNGNDPDKCSCGWQEYDVTSKGCFLGSAIEGEIKPRPKMTRSQKRYRKFLDGDGMYGTFAEFLKYERRAQNELNR